MRKYVFEPRELIPHFGCNIWPLILVLDLVPSLGARSEPFFKCFFSPLRGCLPYWCPFLGAKFANSEPISGPFLGSKSGTIFGPKNGTWNSAPILKIYFDPENGSVFGSKNRSIFGPKNWNPKFNIFGSTSGPKFGRLSWPKLMVYDSVCPNSLQKRLFDDLSIQQKDLRMTLE